MTLSREQVHAQQKAMVAASLLKFDPRPVVKKGPFDSKWSAVR